MPAPIVKKVRVPFDHTTEGGEVVRVTYVYIQAILYSDRFVWYHITEENPECRFGPCAMSISAPDGRISTSVLSGGATSDYGNGGAVTAENSEHSFCSSLSRKISQRIYKETKEQVAAMVNCSIESSKKILLLGTEAGSGFDVSIEFGSLVFRTCLQLLRDPQYGVSTTADIIWHD